MEIKNIEYLTTILGRKFKIRFTLGEFDLETTVESPVLEGKTMKEIREYVIDLLVEDAVKDEDYNIHMQLNRIKETLTKQATGEEY